MDNKSLTELEKLEIKLQTLNARRAELKNKEKEKERKERTKRLINIGASVEHYAGCTIEDMDAFNKYLEKYAYAIANTQNLYV